MEALNEALNALAPTLLDYVVRVGGVLIGLLIAFRIAAWLEGQLVRVLSKRAFDAALTQFFGNMLKYLVLTAAVLACLGIFGVETTTFAAVIGAAGLAVGLAFQGTLANFAAGVLILAFRPFDLGDYIVVAGEEGEVIEIGLFVTAMNTLDNRRVFVGNAQATSGVIENVTKNGVRRVDIDVATHVAADIDESMAVLDAAAAGIPGRHPEHGHQIFLAGFGDGCMNWQVRVWCETADYWDVWHDTVLHTKRALVAANMSAPYGKLAVELTRDAA